METVVPKADPAARSTPRPQRRRVRWPIAVYLLSGLLVVVAAVLVASAIAARSSAAEARDHAEALARQQAAAEDAARWAGAMSEDLVAQVRTVEQAVEAVHFASNRYLNSRDTFVAAGRAAIDMGNRGDVDGELALLEGEVTDLLADLEPLLLDVQSRGDELAAAVRRLHPLVDALKGGAR